MSEPYLPPSEFLQRLIGDDTSGELAGERLARLMKMTADDDIANRDWAALLLAQQEADTPEVRKALLAAADDAEPHVRAEAILGLAQRDVALALPLLQRELAGDAASMPLFEAAVLVADPSLTPDLEAFAEPSGNDFLDELALKALEACQP